MKRNASASPYSDRLLHVPLMREKEATEQMAIRNAINLLEDCGYKVIPPASTRQDEIEIVRGKSYTISEVAMAWRVCYRTVYRMVTEGKLLAIKIGKVYRIPEEAMLMYERYSKPKPCKPRSY